MKRNIVASICVLLVTSIAPASAQVVIDLSLITCKQLLDSDAERQALISSWMSGYFSATKNLSELDFRYVKRNATVVGNYCKTHKSDTVMNAMQKNWRLGQGGAGRFDLEVIAFGTDALEAAAPAVTGSR